jgi:hypothetical protein
LDGVLFQIPKKSLYRSYTNKRIDVHVLLDGSVELSTKKKKRRVRPEKAHAFAHSERTRSGKVALWTYFQSINL